ncbi:PQQ-dependent sugar dehydrogenase [Clostridium sp. AL.422]|uniref:PQQ-dependent sugar dehydrogenase n=1 Tax=Clostridium TaxID=1485 RepID=UPI00293DB910|nr:MULTISPECIES: PQQ-dependent sugar dehydrogenase [unclassified Clostridium]MDV4152607.1 PQQ-dependent sugar dehydrogenase [Clostridium sp. AL.422]
MKKILHKFFYNNLFNRNNLNDIKIKIGELRQIPYKIEVIAEKLYVPWAIDISNDGKIYFTERSGSIRVIENGKVNPNPIFTFRSPFISTGEGGLMGIALDPNYSQNHYIYVMHSYSEGIQIFNRVVRLIENNNKASIDKILIDKIPGGQIHNGGRIKIGPDNKLYITTGDAGNPSLAQDLNSIAGKILRIELDGSIPNDNPFNNSPIYSLGHRNPEGLAWNPKNVLYSSEHGQTAHDEINIIKPGTNYGWPLVQGNEESTDILTEKPLLHSNEITWAPSGITFINQGPWQGNLLVATLRGQQLLSISMNGSGDSVKNIESWLGNEYGRLREVIQASDGSIYLATSNKDGRGNPSINDDRILLLTLK